MYDFGPGSPETTKLHGISVVKGVYKQLRNLEDDVDVKNFVQY